jgi:hypothetical protein
MRYLTPLDSSDDLHWGSIKSLGLARIVCELLLSALYMSDEELKLSALHSESQGEDRHTDNAFSVRQHQGLVTID